MARNLMVAAKSGSGKSSSIRTLDPATTFVIKPNHKPLPWKGSRKQYSADNKNEAIVKTLKGLRKALMQINDKLTDIKTIIVEDFFHLILQKTMEDINKPGFNKYKDLANEIYQATAQIEHEMREDLTVVYMTHTEEVRDPNGLPMTKLKLSGKFTEEVTDLPSYFTYVLEAKVIYKDQKPEYKFLTNKESESDLAKTPMGCFEELYIPNDLQIVIDTIDKYENEV